MDPYEVDLVMTNRGCKVTDCQDKHFGKGFCRKHYQRWKVSGTLDSEGNEVVKIRPKRYCKIDGCGQLYHSKGFCKKHYASFKVGNMDINGNKTKNGEAVMDNPVCKVSGCDNKSVVKSRQFCSKHYAAFREKRMDEDGNWIGKYAGHIVLKDGKRICKVDGCENRHFANGFCQKHNHTYVVVRNVEFLRDRYFDGGLFKCIGCDNTFDFACMDLHHPNGKMDSGNLLSFYLHCNLPNYPERIAEIDRCEWYCARCHDALHNDPTLTYEQSYASNPWKGAIADNNMRKLIAKYGNLCDDCGAGLLAKEIQFHHRNRQRKAFVVKKMLKSPNWDRLDREVAKCDVLCRNCHRLRHSVYRDNLKIMKCFVNVA
jgi:hypothetical protein